MRKLKWGLGIVSFLMVAVLGGGLHAIWPFKMFPTTQINISRVEALPAASQTQLLAGIAVRDITTPIGIPKLGYSAWARQADGFRTRLYARAFYIKPKQGLPVAVVQADLPVSSLLLHHRVAELVAAKTDISFQSLSIHVTHTHSGPGQFMTSDFYNTFGSNKPGFDPDVYAFLSQQIADALIEAYESRQPARIAVGQTDLYGATKNRSLGAYIKNENVTDKSLTEENALRAVNPTMTMVRIDVPVAEGSDDYLPLGVFTSFAAHGTGIPAFTRPYHGDVWAFFERDLEWQIKQHYQTPWHPVHGPFESTHGDNNPNWKPGLRGDLEARRIGKLMAKAGWQLFKKLEGELQQDMVVKTAMRELDLLNLGPQDAKGLCDRAIAGAALVGAAQGDEIFPISYTPPFRRGWPKQGSDDCHKEKNYMLSVLQPWAVEPERFPHLLAVSAHQIGPLMMVGLPFEVTLEAGNRIAHAMRKAVGERAEENSFWVVASHTNGFFGYATTREEYSQQWYEGGHTLYGPGTTAFLAQESARLTVDMLQTPGYSDLPSDWQFNLATQHFFPESRAAQGSRTELEPPQFHPAGNNREAYWSFHYRDVNPSLLQLHQPLLSLELKKADIWETFSIANVPVDDQGYDMQLVHLEDLAQGMSRYEVRWFNPAAADGEFRFAVKPRNGLATFYSSAFHSSALTTAM